MKILILLTLSQFGLCQDSIGAIVDILKPNQGLRDCTLPREFTVRVRTHNDSVTLQLETSTSVKKTTPVYVSRQDEKGNPIIVRDTVLELEGTAEYQDVIHMANIEVNCVIKAENQPYYAFEGFLLLSGPSMYELKPTGTESASSDIKYTLTSSPVHIPPIDNDDDGEKGQSGSDSEMMASESLRKKRQIQEPIYVDVITVIAFSVYERWYSRATQLSEALKHQETKQGIKRHFAHLVNGVDLRYKKASPLYNINLVGYIIEDVQLPRPFQSAVVNETKIDGDKLLNGTRQWKADTPGFPDNDHIIVFTANDLFIVAKTGQTRNLLEHSLTQHPDTVRFVYSGYAYVGTICETPYNSVSAVEYTDNLIDDILVTTHEVGHALSARHDGEYNNTCNSTYKYIMSGSGYSRTHVLDHNNYYVFSTCSSLYFQTFIQGILTNGTNAQQQCLQTSLEPASVTNITGTMPGQLYDVHTQCQMMFGPGFVLRSDIDIGNSENICKRMVCGKEQLKSSRNAAEGTSCGNKKWCVAGHCVFSIDAPEQNNTDCLFGNQPIVYPGNRTCAELISAKPRLCYNPGYLTACCETCPVYKRNDENCLYGDRYRNCDTVTQDTKRLCYSEGNARGCCETCPLFKSAVANCTYGDRYSNCDTVITQEKKRLCYIENNTYGCCETCSAYSSGGANCTYGDRYSDCDTVITQERKRLCYIENNAYGCCETCSAYSSGGDCPYGDNTLTGPCAYSNCITSGPDYIGRCCDTCRNFTSQSSTTTTTTTVPTTTTTTLTSTTTARITTTLPTTTITTTTTTTLTSTTTAPTATPSTTTTTTTVPTTTTTTLTSTTTEQITTTLPTTTITPTTTTTLTSTTTTPTTTTMAPTTTATTATATPTTVTTTTVPTTTITTLTSTTTAQTTTTLPTTTPIITTITPITTTTATTTTPTTTSTIPTTARTTQNSSPPSKQATSTETVSSTAAVIAVPTLWYVAAEIVAGLLAVIFSGSK